MPRTLRCAIFALLCGAHACQAPSPAQDPREVARLAVELGDDRRAVHLWTQLWQASGHADLEAALEAARAVARTGDRAGALAILRHHVARFPDAGPAWSELGAQALAAGDAAAAEAAFVAARALQPEDTRAAAGLAQLLRERGEPERALEVLEATAVAARARVTSEAPAPAADPRMAEERGRAALAAGRYREALPAFRDAFAVLPAARRSRADLLALAAALAALPEPRWADAERPLQWLAEARAAGPNDAALPRAIASVYRALGRPADTVEPAREALARDPGDLDALALLLAALAALGRHEEHAAAAAHAEALALTPEERARVGLSP